MSYQVRYTRVAREDLLRLFDFLLKKDLVAAHKALTAIKKSVDLLQYFPFSCRKADPENPFFREMVISFGAGGYVVLFEIENDTTVTVLAVRHQCEEDYH